MAITVTFNGYSYTDTQFKNGGHSEFFFPLLQNLLVVIQNAAVNAAALAAAVAQAQAAVAEAEAKEALAAASANSAAASAASAVLAPGSSATSATNLTVSAGTKNLSIQTGKLFVVGQHVVIADTTAPATRQMTGIISAHNSSTGALTVEVSPTGVMGVGSAATWTVGLSGTRGMSSVLTLPMLSSAASIQTCISPMMPIFESNHAIASLDFIRLMFSGSQFIAVPSVAGANVYTSPDLKVWTARSINGSATSNWLVRNNGATVIACQVILTAASKSTDGGVTWTPVTPLPGSLSPSNAAYTSAGVLLIGNNTHAYVTTDVGATWSAFQTLPHSPSNIMAIGNLMLSYAAASPTYYTSTSGLTGSWTARTLPGGVTAGSIYDDGSGGLILVPTDATKNFWASSDGINWVDLGFNPSAYTHGGINAATHYVPMKINNVWVVGNNHAGVGSVLVKHGSAKWVPTQTWFAALSLVSNKYSLVASNGAGLYGIKPTGSSNILIADGASTKCVGYFI